MSSSQELSLPGLARRDVVCPNANGTTYTDAGFSWAILCNYNYPGNDLPSQPAKSLDECITACNDYKQDVNSQDGASCVAVVYAAGNPNGNPCYLKGSIDRVESGQRQSFVARRLQYNVGDPPVFTSIKPSATAGSTVQPSTFTPNAVTSNANAPVSPKIDTIVQASQETNTKGLTQGLITQTGSTLSEATTTRTSIPTSSGDVNPVTIPSATTAGSSDSAPRSATLLSVGVQTDIFPASAGVSMTAGIPTATAFATESSTSSLSDGAKIGIGVGAAVAAAIIISLILYILCTRRRNRSQAELLSSLGPTELVASEQSRTSPPSYHRAIALEKSRPIHTHEINSSETGASELDSPSYELDTGLAAFPELDSPSSTVHQTDKLASKTSTIDPVSKF